MPIPETEQWYVMRTVGHQTERAIGLRLEEAGIKHFIPLEKKLRKYKDGHKAIVTTPVVGGLLFCCGKESRIDEQVLRSGRRLQWVYQRGKDSSHHMVVPTDEMENFIRAVTSGLEEIHYLPISDANAFAGRMVRLHGGPMDGVVGTLLAGRSKVKRLIVKVGFIMAIEAKLTPEVVEVLE